MIAKIGNTFTYFVPNKFTKKPFWFEITITDLEKFADNLYFIAQGFNFRDTNDRFITFQDEIPLMITANNYIATGV